MNGKGKRIEAINKSILPIIKVSRIQLNKKTATGLIWLGIAKCFAIIALVTHALSASLTGIDQPKGQKLRDQLI